jgi:hypothetical protein
VRPAPTIAIPRGQVALASGHVISDATTLLVLGRDEPFHHTDRHLLHKVADPTPNPLAR